MLQALGYAAQNGARYIAISNGFQWFITLTFVQDQPLGDAPFLYLSRLTPSSRNSARSGIALAQRASMPIVLQTLSSKGRKAPAPPKLSSSIDNYPVPAARNIIANELSVVVGAVLDEVRSDEDETAFLKECYIEPEATASSLTQSAEIVNQRLSTDEKIHNSAVDSRDVPELIVQYVPEKPIVVLGRVGHG